jgi:hypothetical protein
VGAPTASDAPQSAQNFAPDGFSEPHFGQRFGKELPHSAQNFLPALLSVPQLVQRIVLPRKEARRPFFYHSVLIKHYKSVVNRMFSRILLN